MDEQQRRMVVMEPCDEEVAQHIVEWSANSTLEQAHAEHCEALGIDPASEEGQHLLALARACFEDTKP